MSIVDLVYCCCTSARAKSLCWGYSTSRISRSWCCCTSVGAGAVVQVEEKVNGVHSLCPGKMQLIGRPANLTHLMMRTMMMMIRMMMMMVVVVRIRSRLECLTTAKVLAFFNFRSSLLFFGNYFGQNYLTLFGQGVCTQGPYFTRPILHQRHHIFSTSSFLTKTKILSLKKQP